MKGNEAAMMQMQLMKLRADDTYDPHNTQQYYIYSSVRSVSQSVCSLREEDSFF